MRRRSTASPRRARPMRRPEVVTRTAASRSIGTPWRCSARSKPSSSSAVARLEPADLRVGRGGDGERRAAELVVLARAGAAQRGVAARGVGLAAAQRRGRQVVRADLDPAADRPRARRDRVELRAQPVRRGLGVGVGGRDQPVGREQLRGEVHALAAGVARRPRRRRRSRAGRRSPRPRRGRAASVRVGAAVEHEHDLVLVPRDALLGGERGDARADQLLLVAGGDDARRRAALTAAALPSRPARGRPRSPRRARA